MIIYGGSSKDLGTRKLQGAKCPNCEATDIHVHAVVNYGTLFFIPLFPTNKKYSSICGNCDQVLTKKQMPQQMKDKLALEKHHFKSPLYLYAGLGIIALLIGFLYYSMIQDKKELLQNTQNLQEKEVVLFQVRESDEYTFSKIIKHSNDTIYIRHSNYSYAGDKPNQSEYEEVLKKEDEFYSEAIYYFTQKEIDSLHVKGEILAIFKY
jgi:hypothetical protein